MLHLFLPFCLYSQTDVPARETKPYSTDDINEAVDLLQRPAHTITSRELDSIREIKQKPAFYFSMPGLDLDMGATFLLSPAYSLLFRITKHSRVMVGVTVNTLLFGTTGPALFDGNANEKLKIVCAGPKFMVHLRNRYFFNAAGAGVFGEESYRITAPALTSPAAHITANPIKGWQAQVGIYNLPPAGSGIFAGANLFYRQITAHYLPAGYGFNLNLGYKF